MWRVGVPMAAVVLALCASTPVAVAAPSAEVACPSGTLCLYPGPEFQGQPFLVRPPATADGQCAVSGAEFRSAINNTRLRVVTFSRPDCKIPPTPFAMCCSDGVAAGQRAKLNEHYRSVRWTAH